MSKWGGSLSFARSCDHTPHTLNQSTGLAHDFGCVVLISGSLSSLINGKCFDLRRCLESEHSTLKVFTADTHTLRTTHGCFVAKFDFDISAKDVAAVMHVLPSSTSLCTGYR